MKTSSWLVMGLGISTITHATIGPTDYGYGVISKSMAGTGVAQAQDGFSAAINPATIGFLTYSEFDVGVAVLSPRRQYMAINTQTPFMIAPGTHPSGSNYFLNPGFAYVRPINAKLTSGFSIYGNGGLNTNYNDTINGALISSSPFTPPELGVFGGGVARVDLKQLFANIPFAYKVTPNATVGVSVIGVMEALKLGGLANFAPFSIAPTHITNNGTDYSFGIGAIIGGMINLNQNVSLGASYQPKISLSDFDQYDGIVPGGSIDIPAKATVGISVGAPDKGRINVDYQYIWLENTRAFGNLNTCVLPGPNQPPVKCLGLSGGAGFGFRNTSAIKIGGEWYVQGSLTLRAGFAHNNNAVRSSEVFFDVLGPATITNHFTAGFTHPLNKALDFNMGVMYAPHSSTSGVNPFSPAQRIKLSMHQYEVSASLNWLLDTKRVTK